MGALRQWAAAFVPLRQWLGLAYLGRYAAHWQRYQRASGQPLRWRDSYPCLSDWVPSTPFDPHYFYQGAWLSRQLGERPPGLHVDVGSSVLTLSVLSAQVPTVFVDYRPLVARLPGLHCVAGTILALPFGPGTLRSLSCMHVLEHIGLGRYGDPLDPAGSRKAAAELARVLAPGGRLYLTVPVGRERVCFNAHRVFDPVALGSQFEGLRVVSFAWVDDEGRWHPQGRPEEAAGQDYACGMYVFERTAHA